VPAAALHTYFSGAKGFHLLIDTRTCGRVYRSHDLPPRLLPHPPADPARATRQRAVRCSTSHRRQGAPSATAQHRHAGSGLYKVTLRQTNCWVRRLRTSEGWPAARPLVGVTDAGLTPTDHIGPCQPWSRPSGGARRALRRERGAIPTACRRPRRRPEDALCPARRAMWEAQVVPGTATTSPSASPRLRLAATIRSRPSACLRAWSRRQRTPLPDGEVRAIAHSAYSRPYPYN